MSAPTRIGTVEILRQRIYPLVPGTSGGRSMVVEPGMYDLFREGAETFWVMSGRENRRVKPTFESLGRGTLLARGGGDVPAGPRVAFSSPRFGPEAWADLLAEPGFAEGHPEQRLRVTLDAGATS